MQTSSQTPQVVKYIWLFIYEQALRKTIEQSVCQTIIHLKQNCLLYDESQTNNIKKIRWQTDSAEREKNRERPQNKSYLIGICLFL